MCFVGFEIAFDGVTQGFLWEGGGGYKQWQGSFISSELGSARADSSLSAFIRICRLHLWANLK